MILAVPIIAGMSGLSTPGRGALERWQSLDALIAHWQVIIEGLADGLREGDARVMPREPAATCRHCELKPLCRISDSSVTAVEDRASS